jgi:hypothetical protein
MTTVKFYTEPTSAINDNGIASSLFALLEEAIVQALNEPTKTLTRTVNFLGKKNVLGQLGSDSYDILVNGEDAIVDMSIKMGG